MAHTYDALPHYLGEQEVWKSFSKNLPDEIIIYNNREIEGKEFDFCLVVPGKGLVVVEVKGWKAEDLSVLGPDKIIYLSSGEEFRSPKKQSRGYRFNLINKLKECLKISPFVTDLVCFPWITEEEFISSGLNTILERKGVLLKEDITSAKQLYQRILNALSNPPLDTEFFSTDMLYQIRSFFEPDFEIPLVQKAENNFGYSYLHAFSHPVSNSDLLDLIAKYQSGTKLILFFQYSESLAALETALQQWQKTNHILLKPTGVELTNTTHLSFTSHSGNSMRLFNLEAFIVPAEALNLSSDLKIVDGKCNTEEFETLKKLSSVVSFNLDQYQIEHQPFDENIMITAGAGTGKTFSMVSRVAYLSSGDNPYLKNLETDLGMITFTNDAADTMRKRLTELFLNYFRLTKRTIYLKRVREIVNAKITTIHKFCLELLKTNSSKIGLGQNLSIGSDQNLRNHLYIQYLDAYLHKKNEETNSFLWNIPIPNYSILKVLMELADKIFSKNIPVDQISRETLGSEVVETIPDFNGLILKVLVPAEKDYRTALTKRDRVELNQLIATTNDLLSQAGKTVEIKLKCLFVDEFQDTDNSQIYLIKQICKSNNYLLPLFVVGDLKQSIYRFRGATMSAFQQLTSFIPDWKCFSLRLNYRTDSMLLDHMDKKFIKMSLQGLLPYQNNDRLSSSIPSSYEMPFEWIPFESDSSYHQMSELMEVVKKQKEELLQKSKEKELSASERTIAILTRTNFELSSVLRAAQVAGIKISSRQNGGLFQSEAAIDTLKLVNALIRSDDPIVLADFLSSNFFGKPLNFFNLTGITALEKVEHLQNALNQNLQERIGQSWADQIESLHSIPVLSLIHFLFTRLQPWRRFSQDLRQQNQYRFSYDQLIENLQTSWRAGAMTISDLQNYLHWNIVTRQTIDLRDLNEDENSREIKIECLTIHKSKGLEYGTVILPFMDRDLHKDKQSELEVDFNEDGIGYFINRNEYQKQIVQRNSAYEVRIEKNEMINEETRILYVAMTRAIHKLIWMSNPENKAAFSWAHLLKEE